MYSHSLRTRIATGTFTLPIAALLTFILWAMPHLAEAEIWAGLAVTGLTAYALMELNNRYALLRVRSRMVSTTYLVLMLACPMLHHFSTALLPMLCFVLSYFMLFASYQDTHSQGYVFHAFLFAGIGSIFFPPVLIMALLYYFSMLVQLRNFTWRTFMAGVLGVLLPYWLYVAYAIWSNHLDTAFLYLLPWVNYQLPDYSSIALSQWITVGTLGLLSLFALIHFFHTAYNDKIRTRMFFYVIVTQEIVLSAGLALLPQFYDVLLALFIANSAPLLAHYYTLAKGKFVDIWFYLSLLLLLGVAAVNYLEPYIIQ